MRTRLLWMMTVLGAAVPMTTLNGCAQTVKTNSSSRAIGEIAPRTARINHLAFFKLKNPADAAELIADCDHRLGTLPMVVTYFCGQHLDTGRGERVDGNYDVGFYVGFDSEADYSAYVEHPNHKALVTKWQPRWEWIRVNDVLDPTP